MLQVNVSEVVSVVVPLKGGTLDVEVGKLPPHILGEVFTYGLQQKLSDSVSSGEKFPTAKDKKAGMVATLARLMAGDWGATRESDPVKAEARKIATAKIQAMESFKAWAKSNGKKAGDKEYAEKIAANLPQVMALESVQAEAKRRVEAASALEVEVTLA